MTIVRWSPFPEIEAFDRRIRRMLDEVGIAPAAIPAADVYETDKEFTFELEAPGFEENELSVEVSDHTLVVKGEQLETKDEKDKQYRLHERLETTFERRFTLPLGPRSPVTEPAATSQLSPGSTSTPPLRTRRSSTRIAGSIITQWVVRGQSRPATVASQAYSRAFPPGTDASQPLSGASSADLIVLGSHDRPLIEHVLGMSVSGGVARKAHRDVLIAH